MEYNDREHNMRCRPNKCEEDEHVHEVQGSVKFMSERRGDEHNHRFATISDEPIRCGNSHVHEVEFRTDTHEDHYHEFCGRTSTAISVGDGRHVHFLCSNTTRDDGHCHEFRVATHIEDPVSDERR